MKTIKLMLCALAIICFAAPQTFAQQASSKPKVFFTNEITSDNLVKIYEALGREAKGKIAVKLSTGEPGGHNFLDAQLIKSLVQKLNATIVECNTAYGGGRAKTEDNLKAAADHGFASIAPIDIMDADGEISLPVRGGKHLQEDFVGSHLKNYDFLVVLSHFKGHAMGGFGGAIKNISIGIASAAGKAWIHTAGKFKEDPWKHLPAQDDFLESMAESAKAVADYEGKNILYINVINNLSVDCDCDNNPATPEMGNIGIAASLDPVALDQACVDMVFNSDDKGNKALVERINTRHGTHTLYYGALIGLGTKDYELVKLSK